MVEAITNFAQMQIEIPARHASIKVKPVLSLAPESIDAIDVVSALWKPLFLAHSDVVALHSQTRVSMSGIGVVRGGWRGVGADQRDDFSGAALRVRESVELSVTLDDAHDQLFALRTPATRALAVAAKSRFFTLDRAREDLAQFLDMHTSGAQEPVAVRAIVTFGASFDQLTRVNLVRLG